MAESSKIPRMSADVEKGKKGLSKRSISELNQWENAEINIGIVGDSEDWEFTKALTR
jgi:hypothetical protein